MNNNYKLQLARQSLILVLLPVLLCYLNYNSNNNVLFILTLVIYINILIIFNFFKKCLNIKNPWCFVIPFSLDIPLIILYIIFFVVFLKQYF